MRGSSATTLPVLASQAPSSPCQQCGACCAALRVAFHWSEADDALPENGVPVALTMHLRSHERCMRGTDQHPPRCVALAGEVGRAVACTIYPLRPSPCRNLHWHGEHGQPSEQCTRARAAHGMAPLPWPIGRYGRL